MSNKTSQKQLTVRITVDGGVIQNVDCPLGVKVIVRDYDVEGAESDLLSQDESGDNCIEAHYTAQDS